jgi:hypothetical protein
MTAPNTLATVIFRHKSHDSYKSKAQFLDDSKCYCCRSGGSSLTLMYALIGTYTFRIPMGMGRTMVSSCGGPIIRTTASYHSVIRAISRFFHVLGARLVEKDTVCKVLNGGVEKTCPQGTPSVAPIVPHVPVLLLYLTLRRRAIDCFIVRGCGSQDVFLVNVSLSDHFSLQTLFFSFWAELVRILVQPAMGRPHGLNLLDNLVYQMLRFLLAQQPPIAQTGSVVGRCCCCRAWRICEIT